MTVPASTIATTLMQLLGAAPKAFPAARPQPFPPGALPAAPPVQTPDMAPIPPMRPPPASLPGGSFAPQAEAAPPIAAPAPAPAVNPLQELFGGDKLGNMVRAFGRGAGSIRTGSGDPFVAFGSGFGGATEHYDINDALKAKAAAVAENTAYDREQDAQKIQRDKDKDARDFSLRQTSEARQAKTSDLANRKTALEIRRLARENGVSPKEMLEIERVAQAAGENLWGDDRQKAIDETRERLVKQFNGGEGLSDDEAGLTGAEDGDLPMATNEAGDVIVYKDGAWVPQ